MILQPNVRYFLTRLADEQFLFKNVVQHPRPCPSKGTEATTTGSCNGWMILGTSMRTSFDNPTKTQQHAHFELVMHKTLLYATTVIKWTDIQ